MTKEKMQKFDTGATRSDDTEKIDYEGILSPLVLRHYGRYMRMHSLQADGQRRESDNWQKGIPLEKYAKSMLRHFMDVWLHQRGFGLFAEEPLEEALPALLFNVQGFMHEWLKEKEGLHHEAA